MITILLIEDCEEDAVLLDVVLKREDIKSSVYRVSNGCEAIRYLEGDGDYADRRKCPFPDVVFTDLKMPGMDGFEVLRWLRAHPKCSILPTMVFTSSTLDADIQKAYRMGANAYLSKPSTLKALQESVRKAHDFWVHCHKPKVRMQ